MEFGILGLAAAGKSTIFSLLTGAQLPPGLGKSHQGIAKVPDARLDTLSLLFKPRKHTPATVRFVDIPPITKGGSSSLNLAELRTTDALALVLRAFHNSQVPHPEGDLNPLRDLELIETELLLSDLAVTSGRLARLAKELPKHRTPQLLAEKATLERCLTALEQGQPLRELAFSPEERSLLKGFTFLTLKPLLVILNVDEAQAASLEKALEQWGLAELSTRSQVVVTAVCAPLEQEISSLEPKEQEAFLAELGIPDRALNRLLQKAYSLLGLISFFTVGEDECRAWSIPRGTPAVKAAGVIHSDIERGFIRAEVVNWEDLVTHGSIAQCRQKGVLRQEGRDYLVQDGDVITFKFNV